MLLMCPRKRPAKLSFSLFLAVLLLCAVAFPAQSKKSSSSKKADAKKSEKQAKDAKKDSAKRSKKEELAKKSSKDSKKDKASAKNKDDKRDDKRSAKSKSKDKDKDRNKLTAKKEKEREREKEKDSRNKKDPKRLAELRRIEEERREAEQARRAAALAEQRRREQAAREARERHIAFERGLRTETVNNINNDNTEGEDLGVRRAAIEGLGAKAGTVVVMEAKTGKILTIVNQEWAIRNAFKPCSTIKLVTGVAGINEGVINEDGRVGNSGMDLQDALARSNNPYFQRAGSKFGNKKMIEYAKALGLGEPTGLNVAGETGGRLPYGNNNARIYSHGDDFEVTPLQLAVMVSALSNGGKKVVPQIPRARIERSAFKPQLTEQVALPSRTIEGVLPGMVGAAEYGTARRGVDASMGVAGKTGSCITKGSWIGLFASVAPVEDPKYSVVVITRGERQRGKYAAAVAGRVYQALRGDIRRNPEMNIALRNRRHAPADARTVAVADEDEDEAETEIETGGDTEDVRTQKTAVAREVAPAFAPVPAAPKKMIQRTTQSKPVFGPVVIEFDRSGAGKTRPRIVKN